MKRTTFTMLHRAAAWSDREAEAVYFNETRRVFFIEPPREAPSAPIPILPLRPEGTGHPESAMAGLAAGLATVVKGVTAVMQAKGCTYVNSKPLGVWHEDRHGLECIKLGTDCMGDNYDTIT